MVDFAVSGCDLGQPDVSNDDSSGDEGPLKCYDCDVSFKAKHYLHKHLLHHVRQPTIAVSRVALAPIKITLKSRSNNSFEIVPSPKIEDTEDPAVVAADDVLEEEAVVAFSPNYVHEDNPLDDDAPVEEIPRVEEVDVDKAQQDYAGIPGAEPTPPPEPSPDYPKIRIKTGLLKEPLTITEITDDNPNGEYNQTEYPSHDSYGTWATPSLEDPLRLTDAPPGAGENDSSILSNLFSNNNDRAKDLGFTTSDTDFISLDSSRTSTSNALQVYNSSASGGAMVSSNNPLDTLSNLPMQQLAQQVSRLQPNSSNGMHQQNVLINIQQFPQAPPPQTHAYQPHMYPPHPPQPQMYHQSPYQYQPPNPIYYPQAPAYHMPPPPRPQMSQQMPPPSQQLSQQQQQQQQQQLTNQQAQYRQQGPPRQQQPMTAPRQPLQRGQMPSRGAMQMGPRGFNARGQQMAPRQRAPMMRGRGNMGVRGARPRMPVQNGHAQQPNGPRMIKRNAQDAIQAAMAAKRKKMDVLVPDKNDDGDCQVIAVQPKNTGLPQIQSIQGNCPEPADNSIMHLSDSITLSVRNPPPKPPSPKKSDAKDVANILATRGITVTATPKAKEQQKTQGGEGGGAGATPVAINLNSSVCIIPTNKTKGDKMTTVDLTDESEGPPALPKPPQQQQQQQQAKQQAATSKVLPFQCDLCPAKYPNLLSLNKHRQSFHKTGATCDYGIPLIDLRAPGIMQRLATLGIHNYIPLPGANSEATFALPIINSSSTKNGNLNAIGATSVLTLGPIKMFPRPQQNNVK